MAYEDFAVDTSGMGFEGGAAAPAPAPQFYAFPENYGNPKNKIYKLTAGPEDAIRLKGVDGTIFFEGKGPEAAAKAAEIVQQLGKEFNTQATWILDKQTAGGDWKQVSQDTVGQKKTTAINSFLNVAAPIIGSLIPGVNMIAGAALGSVANSALQNKNSAQAMKDAAIAAGSAYIGGKIGPVIGNAAKTVAPGLTNAVTTAAGKFIPGVAGKTLADAGTQTLINGVPTTLFTGGFRAGTNAAFQGLGTVAGAGLGNLVRPNFNPKFDTVDPRDLEQADTEVTTPNDAELVVSGVRPTTPTTVNPLTVAGGALGAGVAGVVNGSTITQPDVNPKLDTTDPRTPAQKLQDWIKANPLQAASLGLTALSGVAGGTQGGKGSGTTGNMPGNIGAAGTTASLPATFTTGTLPPPSSMFTAEARTPAKMDMTTDQWLKYGMGPEKSFFVPPPPPVKKARGGAIASKARKARSEFAVHGAGTGRSDDIPAVLSDGEYVLDAETVAMLGDGSNKAGAEKLDQFRVNLRRHKGANLAKGRISVNAKSPEKYLAGGRVK